MLELRRWLLAAGLSLTVAVLGCGSNGTEAPDDAGTDGMNPDQGEPDAPIPPNIGVWCDPRDNASTTDLTNPTCVGDAKCFADPDNQLWGSGDENGMCVGCAACPRPVTYAGGFRR